MSKYRQFYNDLNINKHKSRFDSTTPFFGKYDEVETLKSLESADLVVSQLVTFDVTFCQKNILDIRGSKDTIFTPYIYLTGFRRMEKLASKGNARVDGGEIFIDALKQFGETAARLKYLNGEISTDNSSRLNASMMEIKRRENLGADVSISDYIRNTFQERLPCYSINHPTPHVLLHVFNQIAKLANFSQVTLDQMTAFQIGRATLPEGTGGLSPYCVEDLGLSYGHNEHWFGRLNQICNYLTVQNRNMPT